MRLEYKETYYDDLDDIAGYISDCFNENLAQDIVREIHAGCRITAELPYIGRKYTRNPYFRVYTVLRKNLLFYHVDEDRQVVVLHRIFDARRDYCDAVDSIVES